MGKAQKSYQPPAEMTVTQLLDAVKTLREQNSSLKDEVTKLKRQVLQDERVTDEHRAMQELLESIRAQVSTDLPSHAPSAKKQKKQRWLSQKRKERRKNAASRKIKSEPGSASANGVPL
ncbi:hypothetical protein EXIGLDRAFT_703711 [Exidia glandulosa HHB12029]|uniref:Uncharacterized protein n=1 Tax=Exidia glandulosa HHB12029 TaxID=1314781 RepID=A0A165L5X9_EXIGL|nr:hypothetical protein EXIGLDRAFT_703711 [Exidia glandulosa HHB12029]